MKVAMVRKARKSKAKAPKHEINLEVLRERFGDRRKPDDVTMPETAMVPIHSLHVDPRYQRNLSTNHVLKMLSEFETSGVGFVYAGRREDGTYWVVDGQQRLQLLKHLNALFPDRFQNVPCEIFDSKGKEHEASLYRVRNHKKKMTSLDIFKAKYVYGDADTLAILRIINKRGLKIKGVPMVVPSDSSTHIQIGCVGAVENAYKLGKKANMGSQVLESTVDSVKLCWGLSENSFRNFIVEGFACFFSTYPNADQEILRESMVGKTPNGIKAEKGVDTTSGFNRARNVALYLLKQFNKKAKGSSRLGE